MSEEEILKRMKKSAYISGVPAGGELRLEWRGKLVARRVGAKPLEK